MKIIEALKLADDTVQAGKDITNEMADPLTDAIRRTKEKIDKGVAPAALGFVVSGVIAATESTGNTKRFDKKDVIRLLETPEGYTVAYLLFCLGYAAGMEDENE